MALIGLGYRSISVAPASVGPVKSMILSLHAGELQHGLRATIRTAEGNVRPQLGRYAEEHGVEIWPRSGNASFDNGLGLLKHARPSCR